MQKKKNKPQTTELEEYRWCVGLEERQNRREMFVYRDTVREYCKETKTQGRQREGEEQGSKQEEVD